jgi:hypothetical protein
LGSGQQLFDLKNVLSFSVRSMKQALDNLDQISRDGPVTATEMPMTTRGKLQSIFNELCAAVLPIRQHESLALFSRAWAESRLTPELIMFRCTWL